jgi:hypothetical protein
MTTEAATYDKKFNAQRGAQRTGLKPDEFEVFKTPNGRFGWRVAASDTGGQPPIRITEPEQATSPTSPKPGKRRATIEQAQAGTLPAAPDFSKPTHARFRAKLAALVALAEAHDVDGLKAVIINPVSTSPKAMARDRDCAILAIEARAAGQPPAQPAS